MTRSEAEMLAIAADWSPWGGSSVLREAVQRDVELPHRLSDSVALVLQGVRRSGKSTLMQQLVEHYGLEPSRCAFVNFEDPRLAGALGYTTLDALTTGFRKKHPRVKRLTFFLDEIQWVEGWERWLRSQLDRKTGNQFVVTGSNAHLLSGKLGTSLTGRTVVLELFPFSLTEARRWNKRLGVEDYLRRGGFPEPLSLPDGDRLLRRYFDDIVERDVREHVNARSSRPLRQLVQMAFESAGSELSLRRLAGATGIAVETAGAYLEAAESAHLLFGCEFFAHSAKKRANRNRKFYPVDSGLRRVSVTRTGGDLGKSLECATFVALRRVDREIYYWRGRGEVDFVVRRDGRITPVQVTWGVPSDRHHRALDEFYGEFPDAAEPLFVTADSFAEL